MLRRGCAWFDGTKVSLELKMISKNSNILGDALPVKLLQDPGERLSLGISEDIEVGVTCSSLSFSIPKRSKYSIIFKYFFRISNIPIRV